MNRAVGVASESGMPTTSGEGFEADLGALGPASGRRQEKRSGWQHRLRGGPLAHAGGGGLGPGGPHYLQPGLKY
jgi:hypothetical protein